MIGWLRDIGQLVKWELAGEIEELRKNLRQCYFVHHKSHIATPETEVGTLGIRLIRVCIQPDKWKLQ
jgi:hypothetical protein